MIKHKSLLYDWGIWLILMFNAYAILHYIKFPNSIYTLYVVFWIQSIFIGLFNVIGILTFTNRVLNSYTVNNQPGNRPGCAAGFFLLHYGGFHLVYFIFLFIKIPSLSSLDFQFIKLSFWAILVGSIMQYIQDKRKNNLHPVNIGTMFVLPYARIVPMHLAILAPEILKISAPIVFLILKTIADVIMHVVYRKYVFTTTTSS